MYIVHLLTAIFIYDTHIFPRKMNYNYYSFRMEFNPLLYPQTVFTYPKFTVQRYNSLIYFPN